jgi:hypothetical protein
MMGGNRPPENTAKILLRRILPETQWEQFNETETVEIPGSRGIYRVSTRELTRVLDPQTRRPRASACLQLTVPAPVHDRVIAEYMLIQNDEDLYWRTANFFPAGLENRVLAEFLLTALDVLLLVIFFAQLHG